MPKPDISRASPDHEIQIGNIRPGGERERCEILLGRRQVRHIDGNVLKVPGARPPEFENAVGVVPISFVQVVGEFGYGGKVGRHFYIPLRNSVRRVFGTFVQT